MWSNSFVEIQNTVMDKQVNKQISTVKPIYIDVDCEPQLRQGS